MMPGLMDLWQGYSQALPGPDVLTQVHTGCSNIMTTCPFNGKKQTWSSLSLRPPIAGPWPLTLDPGVLCRSGFAVGPPSANPSRLSFPHVVTQHPLRLGARVSLWALTWLQGHILPKFS